MNPTKAKPGKRRCIAFFISPATDCTTQLQAGGWHAMSSKARPLSYLCVDKHIYLLVKRYTSGSTRYRD
ncbi:hypothetical protein GCM10025859_39710 [Alicyclobacillus fastidiosus]|nr:hypothetical protein GCM10025859_39710 [Alicyclobacillus fastidiosus]